MRIRFDLDFDAGAWPGPLVVRGREAVAGEAWLGPKGLLGHLEAVLGLTGPEQSQAERAAALVPVLRSTEGFWSRSVDVDALGSARELLGWRDELAFAGWRGEREGMPSRVAELAGLEGGMRPGFADRLRAAADLLARRPGEIDHLELLEDLEHLPRLWRQVFENLALHGTRVELASVDPAPASGDLARARTSPFEPEVDGSLQLLRTDGPWAAAEEVAAWLAAQADLEGTLVIAPTPLLDAELHRFGLPTTGSLETRGGSALLEVLPLVVAVGWSPADPQQVVELLDLLESPVPRRVGGRLLDALAEWPAVGSPDWSESLEEGLEQIDDERRRGRVRERIEGIFRPSADRAGNRYSVAELRRRIALVQQWLRVRREAARDTRPEEGAAWDEAIGQCAAFERMLHLARLDDWREDEIHRFLGEVGGQIANERVQPAQAGIARVASPGAVVGPARRIVWWGFDREHASRPRRLPFSRSERAVLAAAGIELPDPAREAQRLGARWRRPLEQATESLLLVAPRSDEAGEESHPHPLWDEIRAAAPRTGGADARQLTTQRARLAGGRGEPARVVRAPAALPVPQREWQVSTGLVPPRERESNTSAARLLECSFRWAVQYGARLYGNQKATAEVSSLVLGRLAHALLADVVPAAEGDDARARNRAAEWFDQQGPRRVAGLFLPGQEAERARVRRILCEAAAVFCRFLARTGFAVVATEQEISAPGLGRELSGTPDFVLGPRPLVVDAKWAGLSRRRDSLREGTAAQLAFYAHLLRHQPGVPPEHPSVAFFVLSDAGLLTTDHALGEPAQHVPGPDPGETWLALERAYEARSREVAEGRLVAPAVPDGRGEVHPDRSEVDEHGRLVLTPGCDWCDYGGLCGQDFPETTR